MVSARRAGLMDIIVNLAAVKWSYGCEMTERQFRGDGGKANFILKQTRRGILYRMLRVGAILADDLRKLRFLLGRARFPEIFGKRS